MKFNLDKFDKMESQIEDRMHELRNRLLGLLCDQYSLEDKIKVNEVLLRSYKTELNLIDRHVNPHFWVEMYGALDNDIWNLIDLIDDQEGNLEDILCDIEDIEHEMNTRLDCCLDLI
jgi:hypothetical protein